MNRREPPIADHLAGLVADLRKAGLSPQEIARQSGVGRATIWRFENCEANSPAYSTVAKLEQLRDKVKR
jgi:transcriptional regulator with XRE-family HTH domain